MRSRVFRLAWRALSRARGTAFTAILTLGIGLSAAVMLLGIIDSGARPLPVPQGREIVQLRVQNASAKRIEPPAPVHDWAVGAGVEAAGAIRTLQGTLTDRRSTAMRVAGAEMHTSVLRLLQVPPALGRLPNDDPADADAIVLGWDVWQELGGTRDLIGSRIDLDGRAHTVIGVMPEGFGFPERQSFWTVLPHSQSGEIVARLADGADADAITGLIATRLTHTAPPDAQTGSYRVSVHPWTTSRDSGGDGVVVIALGGLVALLLIVCAANVATLLIVRGTERSAQLAVHAALGASRTQVGTQLFMEALLVAVAGGLVGIAGGYAILRWMEINLSQHWGYYWMHMEVRAPVLIATAGVVLLTAVIAGTAPALQAMRIDPGRLLAANGRGGSGRRQKHLGRVFVGAQVTLSTIGLVVAAFLGWGFTEINRSTDGLPLDNTAVASIALPDDRYAEPHQQAALARTLRDELAKVPGARAVTVSNVLPVVAGGTTRLEVPGAVEAAPDVRWYAADENVDEVFGMQLMAGRMFTAADALDSPPVAIVNAAFAEQYLDGAGVGKRIRLNGVHGAGVWAEIVGIVRDRASEREQHSAARVVVPLAQTKTSRFYLSIATAGDAVDVVPGIRRAVARADASLAVEQPQTLGNFMAWLLRMPRVLSIFGMIGGVVGVLVAAVGLYGVIAFQVRSRLPEIGVRMALGADTARIAREVITEGIVRVLPGVGVGLAVGLLAAPAARAFAVTSTTPPSILLLAGVVFAMLTVGVAASLYPALRAARLDPQTVLRTE